MNLQKISRSEQTPHLKEAPKMEAFRSRVFSLRPDEPLRNFARQWRFRLYNFVSLDLDNYYCVYSELQVDLDSKLYLDPK